MKQNYKGTNRLLKFGILKSKVQGLFIFSTVLLSTLNAQQSFTFTPCGATGAAGPTQLQANNTYTAGNSLNGSVTISGQGIQQFTVPTTGIYKIEARGAKGYNPTGFGGRGAIMYGEFNLTAGSVLKIAVGQQGQVNPAAGTLQFGGGGGSFVSLLNNTPLIVAGGGGGSHAASYAASSADGTISTTGNAGVGSTAGTGGTGGAGGAASNSGNGGAGFNGDGGGTTGPALSFTNGALGGNLNAVPYANGGIGGFGGGGGTQSWNNNRGGGGGGYSGGGGAQLGQPNCWGGGGGSYNGGANQVNLSAANTSSDGLVIITEACNITLVPTGVNANGAICSGATVSLTTNAISNYSWNTGASTSSLVVSPTITTSYTLTAMSPSNCMTSAVVTITVDAAPPTLTVTNTANAGGICPTKTVVLTASGATTYTWTGVTTVTNGVAFAPSVAGGYTVNGTNACGTRSAATSVSVHPLPTVIAVASTPSLCSGSSLTLTTTGSNASTYTWTGGFTSGVGFVPAATNIYTVTGTSALSCTAMATVPVTVAITPSGFPTSNPLLVCLGNSATLSVPAASNYTWTNGTQTVLTSTMLVTPTSSGVTTYTVTRANGVCFDTKVLSLTTNDLPTVLVLATPTLVCATHAASLAAAGGQTYTWTASTPANYTFTSPSPVVYPAVNTTYTVAAHDGTCVNTAVISVSTNPLPTLTITPSPASGSICVGQQVSLTASGGVNYTWTTVNTTSTGATVTDSPTSAVVYNLEGDNIYGCTSTAQQVMLVYPIPTVNISITKNPMVCTGGQSTLSANGANSYTWDANAGGVNTNTAVVTSTNITSGPVVYTVTGSYNSTGCSSSKTIAISVFIPTLTVSGNTNTCDGGNVTLSAGGGNTYSWTTAPGNPPYTFPTITTSLSAPTVFTLAGITTTSGISCPSSMTIGLGIYYNPTITATASRTLVCKGENVDLMADGGVSYVWSNSQPGGTITVVPTNISTYTVTGTDVNGCTSTGTVLVRYSACNGINEFSASNAEVVIYPNPNNGQFVIKAGSDLNLTISNELGQPVRFLQLSGANEHKVSIEGLAQGIYFVTGDGITQKIVVTK